VKGAFLDADKAFEVINGMRTLELRMLQKCIATLVLSQLLARHPGIRVRCNAVPGSMRSVPLSRPMKIHWGFVFISRSMNSLLIAGQSK